MKIKVVREVEVDALCEICDNLATRNEEGLMYLVHYYCDQCWVNMQKWIAEA